MKKHLIALAVLSACITAAQAGEFDGGYAGAKIGVNRTDITGYSQKSPVATGLEGGYNWNMGSYLLGVDGFLDVNGKKTHGTTLNPMKYGSNVYGLDLKLGFPDGKLMPYFKLGYADTKGSGDLYADFEKSGIHPGVGFEYKFAPQWSAVGEMTSNTAKDSGKKLRNDNLMLGLNYYFDKPAAPVVVPVAKPVAPVVVKAVEPKPVPEVKKVEPAPAPKEAWKVIMEETPVRIEGASFDTDSAKLKPAADEKLKQVVDFAAKYPEANLEVSGHTDDRASEVYNLKLSDKRAAAVKAYLVKKGVAASRITAKGYGKGKPVADNKTKEGRATNRRVEVRYTIREEKRVRVQ